jgi:hypothetical protein
LLKRGFRVFASVRKPADADRLKAQLGSTPLILNVIAVGPRRPAPNLAIRAFHGCVAAEVKLLP